MYSRGSVMDSVFALNLSVLLAPYVCFHILVKFR